MKRLLIVGMVVLFVGILGVPVLYSLENTAPEITWTTRYCCEKDGWECWTRHPVDCTECYLWCGNLGGDISMPFDTSERCVVETTWSTHSVPQILDVEVKWIRCVSPKRPELEAYPVMDDYIDDLSVDTVRKEN